MNYIYRYICSKLFQTPGQSTVFSFLKIKQKLVNVIYLLPLLAICLNPGCKNRSKKDILALVNGEEILCEDFLDFYNSRPRVAAWTSQEGRLDPEQVLDALIDKTIISQRAKEKKFDRLPGFKEQIKKFQEKEMINLFIEKFFDPKVHIPDEEVQRAIPEYQKKEVRFARICVLTESEAWEIKKELDQGADFSKIARERSIGLEAENDGIMDFLSPHRGIYHKDVIKTIFELPIGKISNPQKIREGYAIFKPIEEKSLNSEEMDQVRQYTRSLLFREKKRQLIRDMLEKTKRENGIIIHQKAIKEISKGQGTSLEQSDILLAEINGEKIFWTDIKMTLPEPGKGQKALWEDPNILNNIISSRIDQILMLSQAKKAGFEKDADLKKQTDRFIQDVLARQLLIDEVENQIIVTDQESQKYYQDNITLFSEPEMIKVSHILLHNKEKANEVLSLIKKGADFAAMAEKYSEYKPSSKRGGDLGYIQQGTTGMGKTFEEAAFSLKKGEVSNPIETPLGYQLIFVNEKKSAETMKFDDVKNKIVQELRNQKREKFFKAYLENLRNNAKIEIKEKLFNEIKQQITS